MSVADPDLPEGSDLETGVQATAAGKRPASLLISEIFGPTVQGEGVSLGRPSMFVRTAGCPLSCSWCDTPYSWDWKRFDRAEETSTWSPHQAWERILDLADGSGVSSIVLTGGEPASQARGLAELVKMAKAHEWWVEMETSGSVDPGPLLGLVDLITVSPKTAGAGMLEQHRIKPAVLRSMAVRSEVAFKFVIDSETDLIEADRLVAEYRPARVLVMAQATSAAAMVDRTAWLVPHAIRRGWTVTPRLHVMLWGDERGR